MTTRDRERGQASRTRTPFLHLVGVTLPSRGGGEGARSARACSLLHPAWTRRVLVPRRLVLEMGEEGVVPEVVEGVGHQLYDNEGLAPPPAPPLTWAQLLLQSPPSIPDPAAPSPFPRSVAPLGQEGLSWLQSLLKPLEGQGEGLRPGRPGSSPIRRDVG